MDLIEILREKMRTEFGITTKEELKAAVEKHNPVDLGIFVTQIKEENDARSA